METITQIAIVWLLGLLGILLYAATTVWKKAKQEGFSLEKFFVDNKLFWIVCLGLNFLLAITIAIIPESQEILHALGFAVDTDSQAGYALLGIALAAGSDKTKLTGTKELKSK